MATDVTIPALGESITEATVGEWLKAPGDAVAVDEPIVSLETDKVAVEVPSPVAGTMGEQLFKVGDTVNVGALIARIEGGAGAPAKMAAPTPAVVESVKAPAAEPSKAEAPKPEAKAATVEDRACHGGTGQRRRSCRTRGDRPRRPPPARRLQPRPRVDHRHRPRRATDQG